MACMGVAAQFKKIKLITIAADAAFQTDKSNRKKGETEVAKGVSTAQLLNKGCIRATALTTLFPVGMKTKH